MALVSEAMVNIPSEFVVILIRALAAAVSDDKGRFPPWIDLRVAIEDWWKGYRQLQPAQADIPVCIVAIQDPTDGSWRYSQLRGLPFGLGAAVNQFGRPASLLTAMARRLALLLAGHYVDDNALVEVADSAWGAHMDFQELAHILGPWGSNCPRVSVRACPQQSTSWDTRTTFPGCRAMKPSDLAPSKSSESTSQP